MTPTSPRSDGPRRLTIGLEAGATVSALAYEAFDPQFHATLVLAHGAGAGQFSPFMTSFATALSALGLDTVTFNFLYTERGRRVPDRRPSLEACYRAVVRAVRNEIESAARCLFIGGKSMGGRIATYLATDSTLVLAGVVLLGYPLHPPGRPGERRDSHLPDVRVPMLFVQGSNDAFGTPAELEPALATLSPAATLHVVEGGDHSFKVPRAGPTKQEAVYADVQRTVAGWTGRVSRARQEARLPSA